MKIKNKYIIHLITVSFLFCLQQATVSAQDIQSDVSGFYANVNLYGAQWDSPNSMLGFFKDEESSGWGLQLSGGYGFTQRLEAFAQFSYTNFNMSGDWDDFSHSEFGAGFRYNFGATLNKLRPFLDVQLNASNFTIDRVFIEAFGARTEGALELSGTSVILGGGARYFFRPWLAGVVHARYHIGMDYDAEIAGQTVPFDEEYELSQFDIGVGVAWYFGKKF